MNNIIKIKKLLKYSSLLIDGVTETTKNEIKKTKCEFLGCLLALLAASFV